MLTDIHSENYKSVTNPEALENLSPIEIAIFHHNEYKGLFESRFKLFQLTLEEKIGIKNIQILTDCIDRDHTKVLIPYKGSHYMSSLYYFSLPFDELSIERKNQCTSAIAKVLL